MPKNSGRHVLRPLPEEGFCKSLSCLGISSCRLKHFQRSICGEEAGLGGVAKIHPFEIQNQTSHLSNRIRDVSKT